MILPNRLLVLRLEDKATMFGVSAIRIRQVIAVLMLMLFASFASKANQIATNQLTTSQSPHATPTPAKPASTRLVTSEEIEPQTVRFHAWGGSAQVNGYLQWVSEQVKKEYNINLQHVKLADTSDAVSRVLSEKAAGNHSEGSVDLIWINGENFAAMKQHGLLEPEWVSSIENFALTNPQQNAAMVTDFSEATLGMEAPWGKASMVFYYRQSHLEALSLKAPLKAPTTIEALLTFAQKAPGRFTYPIPNDYLGITFLKYAALTLNKEYLDDFYSPVSPEALARVLPALWQYLDKLHPLMWRKGQTMLRQASQLQRLMGSGELSLAFSFTAAEIPSAVERFDLPLDIRTYAMHDGSLANVHFIGLTFNAASKNAAKTVVNFLLSPEAQAQKQKLTVWGDDTVLDMTQLNQAQRQLFIQDTPHASALDKTVSTPLLAEPHASWTDALRDAWFKRYGARY